MLKKSSLAPANRGPVPPDITDLHQLLSQALEKRGHAVQATWGSADKMTTFLLNVISNFKGGDPQWTLSNEFRGVRTQMFDYSSCDVLLVHNLMASSVQALNMPGRTQSGMVSPFVRREEPTLKMTDAVGQVEQRLEPVYKVPKQGDIAKMSLNELLEVIAKEKATGKLEVRNRENLAVVYLQDGKPVDATASDAEGDDAIIELLTWREGQFLFEARVLRNAHTVHQTIDALMAQSRQLAERTHYLKEAGMMSISGLVPKRPNITDLEFVQKAVKKRR